MRRKASRLRCVLNAVRPRDGEACFSMRGICRGFAGMTARVSMLLCLTLHCAGCGLAGQEVTVVERRSVPAQLLTPIEMPSLTPPVTVRNLLVHCRALEDGILKANERFEEIRNLQKE